MKNPFSDSKFALSALQFIGLIGGAEAMSVLAMIPLYRGRRWLGWYNSPGSLDVARHLANFASSFLARPYRNQSPATLLGFDSKAGPTFIAAFSEGETRTGHFGYLAVERSKELASGPTETETLVDGRAHAHTSAILLDLGKIDLDSPFPLLHISHTLLALVPITISLAMCIMCALASDWFMFSVILSGMVTNGFASMVIGSGRLTLVSPRFSAPETPPGRGIIISMDTVVVVRGEETGVNAITRGTFVLDGSKHWHTFIHLCSLLYLAECLAQLVFIPQGTLFGQIMFIASLLVSWFYSYLLASFNKERLQAELLFIALGQPTARKLPTRSSTWMAVFVCLLLFQDVRHLATANDYERILGTFLPDATPVWRAWKDRVIQQLLSPNDMLLLHLQADENDILLEPLLGDLLRDATDAFRYFYVRFGSPF